MFLNKKRLAENGIVIPVSMGEINQRKLPVIAYNPTRQDEFTRAQGVTEPAVREKAFKHWWDAFLAELEQSGCPNVLVSSEHFQSRLRTREEIERLREILAAVFDEIEIILYLREPVETAVSLFSTAVRSGSEMQAVPGPSNEYFHNIVNHRRTIQVWSQVFGAENIRIRLFEKSLFKGGDLLLDFIHTASLPDIGYKFPPRANESLSALGISILSRLNTRQRKRVQAGKSENECFQRMTNVVCANFSGGAAHIPNPEVVEAYRQTFSESNEWVRKTFFPDLAQLFHEKSYENNTLPVTLPEDDLQRLCNVIEKLAGCPGD